MALTNRERVGEAIELLRDGLKPFVEPELAAVHGPKWAQVADLGEDRGRRGSDPLGDPQVLLNAIWFNWEQVFKRKPQRAPSRRRQRALRDQGSELSDSAPGGSVLEHGSGELPAYPASMGNARPRRSAGTRPTAPRCWREPARDPSAWGRSGRGLALRLGDTACVAG